MSRTPLFALTAAVALIAAVAIVATPEPVVAWAEVPPAPPLSDTPPSTAYVLAGAVEASALTEIEQELTDEANSRATTTTSTTSTTTALAETDAEVAASEAPPSSVATTTTAPATTTTVEEPPATGSFDAAAESQFAGNINSLRSSNGKGSLTRDGSLDARARDWAKHMADSGSLSHSNLASLMPPWSGVAENLGQGGSVSQIFNLLAGSSGHLSNMLGDFTHLGIGVWRDGNGVLWTAHLFAR